MIYGKYIKIHDTPPLKAPCKSLRQSCSISVFFVWICWIVSHKGKHATNVANPIDDDNIIGNAEQIQLTNMRATGAQSRRQGTPLASIFVSWMQGTADYRSLSIGFATLHNLRCQQDNHPIQLSNLCRSNIKGRCDDCEVNTVDCGMVYSHVFAWWSNHQSPSKTSSACWCIACALLVQPMDDSRQRARLKLL